MASHASLTASTWVARFLPFVRAGGAVLDVACGFGRHARLFAQSGYRVTAVDRDEDALATLSDVDNVMSLHADIESGPWPLAGRSFDAIVVTNYLHRPLFPVLLSSLSTEGLLIYETFAAGNERYGRPASPQFLLEPGELLQRCAGLRVLAYEDTFVAQPKPALIQRICATRSAGVPHDAPQ